MTADQLRDAEAAYRAALVRSEDARRERNRLVLEALELGWTHRQVAEVTGLSRARISQLLPRR